MNTLGIINVSGNYDLKVNPQWNLLQLETIYLHCDTSAGPVNITLFGISELLKRWNVSIYVVDISENSAINNITVNCAASDFIGSSGASSITINQNGGSATFMPVSEISWAFCTAGSGEFCDITLTPQTIIYGELLSFTKTDYGSEIDYINPGVTEITRGNNQGIFNIALELGYQFNVSPANTGWNADGWGNLLDIQTRTYQDWGNAIGYDPPGSVGDELVMIDYSTNQYYLIKFTQWTQGNVGGGFAYDRQEIVVTEKCKITFSDGTVQDTAAGEVESGTGINVVKTIDLNGKVTYTVNSLPVAAPVNYSNVLFVDPIFGNNSTALAGRFDKPYSDIGTANNNVYLQNPTVTNRTLIYIRKGVYNGVFVQLLNNVDYYCEPGVVFTGSAQIRDQGITVNSNWYGSLKFENSYGSSSIPVSFNGPDSNIYFEFDTIKSSAAALQFLNTGLNNNIRIKGNSVFSYTLGQGFGITIRNNANVTLDIAYSIEAIHSTIAWRFYTGKTIINCPRIGIYPGNIYGGNFKHALIVYDGSSTGTIEVNANIICNDPIWYGGIASLVRFWASPSVTVRLNGDLIAVSDSAIEMSSGNSYLTYAGNIKTPRSAINVAQGTTNVKNSTIVRVGSLIVGPIGVQSTGVLYMNDSSIYSEFLDGNIINIETNAGKLYLKNIIAEGVGINYCVNVGIATPTTGLINVVSNKPNSPGFVNNYAVGGSFAVEPNLNVPKNI